LLVGFHAGDERRRPEHAYGHPVSYDTYLLPPDRITELLSQAGMVVTARLLADGKKWPQACLWPTSPGRLRPVRRRTGPGQMVVNTPRSHPVVTRD
jgi:hypothetical protein